MGKTRQRQFAAIDSGEWVEASGIVIKLLQDDNEGSRHQRFIVDLRNDQTLLIAHNIDLAPRIPLAVGDRLKFRGMYESNDLGGLVHWTHHDPMGVEDGGFIICRRRTSSLRGTMRRSATTQSRHCEERSDAAIQFLLEVGLDHVATLAMTKVITSVLNASTQPRHCEERSDAAIQFLLGPDWIALGSAQID